MAEAIKMATNGDTVLSQNLAELILHEVHRTNDEALISPHRLTRYSWIFDRRRSRTSVLCSPMSSMSRMSAESGSDIACFR